MGERLFSPPGLHPRSAESSLVDSLKIARAAGLIVPLDRAAVGNAYQSARAVDDALRAEERADNIATLIRAHLANLEALELTPRQRHEREARDVASVASLFAGLGPE